jgi:hypothetical protein
MGTCASKGMWCACMGRPVSWGGTELCVANDVLPAIDANVSARGAIVSKQLRTVVWEIEKEAAKGVHSVDR